MQFGKEVKAIRLSRRLNLREFCRQASIDASNWSKIERGVMPPPQDQNKLSIIAEVLGVTVPSKRFTELMDLAAIDAGIIPKDLLNEKETLDALPIFFRTIRSKRPTTNQLEQLLDAIRKEG